jgi:MFS family permease
MLVWHLFPSTHTGATPFSNSTMASRRNNSGSSYGSSSSSNIVQLSQPQQQQQHQHDPTSGTAAAAGTTTRMGAVNVSGIQNNNHHCTDDSERERYMDPTQQQQQQQQQRRPSFFVIQVTLVASLGGILFGYDLGIISCALPQLTTKFSLSSKEQELIVSILYLGGTLGATVGGSICDVFGRKKSILLCDIIFGVGAAILYAAHNVSTLVLGRIVVGFAIALSGIADVTYLHEISPVQFRGAIVSVNEACISLGFLLAFGIGSIPSLSYQSSIDENDIDGWRIMFGASGIVALLQFMGMIYMPESPKWLSDRGRHEESEVAYRQIQSNHVLYQLPSSSSFGGDGSGSDSRDSPKTTTTIGGPTTTYQSISSPVTKYTTAETIHDVANVDFITNTTSSSSSNNSGLIDRICCYPIQQMVYLLKQFYLFLCTIVTQYRRQTYITFFLAVTQQFCGQTNVLSYAPLIFAAASSSSSNDTVPAIQGWATLSIGLVKFLVTVLVIWKIESIGRRRLLLGGIATIAFGLFLLSVAFAGSQVVSSVDSNSSNVVVVDDGQRHMTQVKNTNNGFNLALPGVLYVFLVDTATITIFSHTTNIEIPTTLRGYMIERCFYLDSWCAVIAHPLDH